jgi:hypothetical protein
MASPEDRILRRLPFEILAFSAVMAAGSLLFFRPLTALFVLVGGLLSCASFVSLKRALARFLGPDRKAAVKSGVGFYFLRLLLIIAVFLIIIRLLPGMILALAAGFSSIVPVFMAEAVMGLSQMRKWKG